MTVRIRHGVSDSGKTGWRWTCRICTPVRGRARGGFHHDRRSHRVDRGLEAQLVTPEDWDTHYWRIRSSLKQKGVYEGDEATQRQIALDETTEQFGPRPQETP